MIKRLRNRFIRIATLSVAAVMLLLTVILNVANYISTDNDLQQTLTLIYENQGTIPQGQSQHGADEKSPELPRDTADTAAADEAAAPPAKPGGRDGPFTQETPYSNRNAATGGFGIGLSIARSIADGHKGSIHARQADGRIEFVVELK